MFLKNRRSSLPPPLPPKPSAPPSNLYPPQIPYYHPPTAEHLNYQNQMRVMPEHFYPSDDEFYVASNRITYAMPEDFRPPLPIDTYSKPPTPVPLPRRRSLPRICSDAAPIFVRLQTATAEFRNYTDSPIPRRNSVSR